MKHIKLFEAFCEGDMDDMMHIIRSITEDFETLHYGFDYIEIRLGSTYEIATEQQEMITRGLLDKFDQQISEIYSEETGWFKIYFRT